MRHSLAVGLWILVIVGMFAVVPSPARAQGGDGETLPACAGDDLQPITEIAIGLLDLINRQSNFTVAPLLDWRGRITALEPPACAEGYPIYLQLRLAADELLIGALLLERGGESTQPAAEAINAGATALAGLRFSLSTTVTSSGGTPIPADQSGDLTGAEVLAAFEAAGLPFDRVQMETGPAGRGAPRTEIERITFGLPTVFDGGTGQILVFDSQTAMSVWLNYLFGLDDRARGELLVYANVIVQLDAGLDQATARQFRTVLEALE